MSTAGRPQQARVSHTAEGRQEAPRGAQTTLGGAQTTPIVQTLCTWAPRVCGVPWGARLHPEDGQLTARSLCQPPFAPEGT